MALITANTRCPICNNRLAKPYTVTSGVVFARTHPLWQFCDAPLHFDCLETWPSRIEFSEGYFNAVLQHYQTGSGGFLLIQEKDWLFAAGPVGKNGHPLYVDIRFREWPVRLYSRWQDYDQFVAGGFREGLAGSALQLAEQTMRIVIQAAPDLAALSHLLHKLNA